MGQVLQQVPIDAVIVGPFAPLADFATHENQFLGGLGVHIAEQRAEIGEFLPIVAGHFAQEGALAVDHLVMGQGK